MRFPNHGTLAERKQRGKIWGGRSVAARAQVRIESGVDAETSYRRALHDAKGATIREGCTYTATSVRPWLLRQSVNGRTDQVDLLVNGVVVRTCGRLAADSAIRWAVWPRKATQAFPLDAVNLRGGKVGVSSKLGRSASDCNHATTTA